MMPALGGDRTIITAATTDTFSVLTGLSVNAEKRCCENATRA